MVGTDQYIAHLTLHRVVEPDTTSRGFLENHVCRIEAVTAGKLVSSEVTYAHISRYQLATGSVAPGFIGVGQHAGFSCGDLGEGFTQLALDERIVDRSAHRLVQVLARHHMFHIQIDHATCHADDDGGHGCIKDEEERHFEQVFHMAVGFLVVGTNHMTAVCGYEYIRDHQLLAAGTRQTDHVPVINDLLDLLTLNPEGAEYHLAVLLYAATDEGTAFGMVATAGGQPLAIQAIAAFDRIHGAEGRVGGGNQFGVVLPPQFIADLFRQQTHLERVYTQHHHVPGAGRAAAGQLDQYPVEHVGVHLVAAPAFGLQDFEKSRLLEVLNGLPGYHACFLAGIGPFAQRRDQVAGALYNLFFGRNLGHDSVHIGLS